MHDPSPWTRRHLITALAALPWAGPLAGCASRPSGLPTATHPSSSGLPVAPVRPVTDTFFGTAVPDPYRYFEDIRTPEVAAWMKAHSDHARRQLDALPGRAAFAARLAALEGGASERATRVQRSADGRLFYLHRGPKDDQFKLVVRAPGERQPRVLFDPQAQRTPGGPPLAINFFRPSPLGTRVGLGVSAGGSEDAELHVIDTATGQPLMPPLPRAQSGPPGWLDEDQWLMIRLHPPGPGRSGVDRYRDSLTEWVRLPTGGGGAAQITELPVRQWADLGLSRDMDVGIRRLAGGELALLTVGDGVRNEMAFFVGPWAQLRQPTARWTQVLGFEAGVVDYQVHGLTLYGRSHVGAPRFQVQAWDLAQPTRPPRTVLGPSARVVTGLATRRDALYLRLREGNSQQLWRMDHTPGAHPQRVALPVDGQIYLDAGYGYDLHASGQDQLVIGVQGWTRGLQNLAIGPGGQVQDLQLPLLGPTDLPEGLAVTEVLVPSHDGAQVPMSIVHRAGVQRDGRNPVWLLAYAAYGFTLEPNWAPARLAWLERGGVLAFANPRGSGVFGNAWYEAGKQGTKRNSWLDVIACGEYLVRERWTAPQHLGLSGRSAGGLLVGRVLTARPELFAAVVPQVGVHDAVRMETTPNGPGNIPEFGTVTQEAGFRGLLAMSPYATVQDGTAYPAVLLTHGVNDPRVEVWQSMKFGARLMAATTSTRPVWLSLQYDAGHGMGNTRAQQIEENADVFAFLWHHLGGGRG